MDTYKVMTENFAQGEVVDKNADKADKLVAKTSIWYTVIYCQKTTTHTNKNNMRMQD